MVFNLNISSRRILNAAFSIAVALSEFLMSCSQIEQATPAVGYLHFNTLAVDVTVEGLELTKASVPAAAVPTADDFTYVITNKADGLKYYNKKGLPTEPIALPLGEYKVDIIFGANQFNQAYYADSKDNVLIQKNQPAIVEFDKVPLANAMVAVTLPDMTGHMEVTSITLSDGVSTISVESGEYYFVPVGRTITAFFSGTNSLGESKSVSISVGTPEAQHAYNVVCNLDLPSFTFAEQSSGAIAGRLYLTELASLGDGLDASKIEYQISSDGGQSWNDVSPELKDGYWVISKTKDGTALLSDGTSYQIRAVYGGLVAGPWNFTPSMPSSTVSSVSISHTYKSTSFTGLAQPLSVLTGTAVTSNGSDMKYPAIVSDLISTKGSRGVELVNANGDVVRSIVGKETGSMSTFGDWIYLPKGTYTVKTYFGIGDDKIYLSSLSATSPAPEFTVTAYAETSYSRYLNYKNGLSGYTLAKANTTGSGDKVMDIKGVATVSDQILSNSHYSDMISAELTYDGLSMLKTSVVTTGTFVPNTLASNSSIDGNISMLDGDDIINQAWGVHYVRAAFRFDGVDAIPSELPCHVTGIPLTAEPPTENVWSRNGGGSWNTDFARLSNGGGAASITSKNFHVPANIPVTVSTKAIANPEKSTIGTTFTLSLGSEQLFSATAKDMSWFQYFSQEIEASTESTVTSDKKSITCNNSYGLGNTCSYVYYVKVLYR